MSDVTVRYAAPGDVEGALEVARALPEWFTPRGLEHLSVDLRFQCVLVACDGDRVVGFASFFANEGVGRIGWLGVHPELRRSGVGQALVRRVLDDLRAANVGAVLVDTLGDSVDYQPYAETRAFYRSVGFVDHARVMQDDPECPEQLTLRLDLSDEAPDEGARDGTEPE